MDYQDIADKFSKLSVLVVGDVILDTYVQGSVKRISPEAPVPILKKEAITTKLGGAANVAANIVSLGATAHLVGFAGGHDPESIVLIRECEEKGIAHHLIGAYDTTISKTRFVVADRHQQMLRVDSEPDFSQIPSDAIRQRSACVGQFIESCDVVVVSDYAKGVVDAVLMEQLRAFGKTVIVDPKAAHTALYHSSFLITPNRKEAAEMLGVKDIEPNEAARELKEMLDTCGILITLSKDGMLLCSDDHEELFPVEAQDVYDVTGAGDTVVALMAMSIGAGLSLQQSCQLANRAAGIAVSRMGTTTVTMDDLIDEQGDNDAECC